MSSLPLPAIVCLTSSECIHCLLIRGMNGQLFQEDLDETASVEDGTTSVLWTASFFGALLTGSSERLIGGSRSRMGKVAVARVFSIHFSTLSADRVIEASEYTLDSETGIVHQLILNPATDVPPAYALLPFAVSYPSWICTSGAEWDWAVAARVGAQSPGELRGRFLTNVSSSRAAVLTLTDSFRPPVYVIPASAPPLPKKTLAQQMKEILNSARDVCGSTDTHRRVADDGIRFIRPLYDCGRVLNVLVTDSYPSRLRR